MGKLILLEHPTQVRIILPAQIQIAPAVFPKEGVFCMGGWISTESCRLLSDSEAEVLIQASPFEIPSRISKKHVDFKFQKP